MKIEDYSFGRLTVDGREYTSDVIIYPDYIDDSWWRQQGHYLQREDLEQVIEEQPDILVIGTGNSGRMEVPQSLIKEIEQQGIRVFVERTEKAVSLYNRYHQQRATAALHLTC